MLVAVIMGSRHPATLVLSRRRSMRCLRLASWRCIVLFTRNPSWLRALTKLALSQTPRKAERFRVFQKYTPTNARRYACLRSRMLSAWTESEQHSWRSRMFEDVHAALRRVQKQIAQILDPVQILGICNEVGFRFRRRVLDPVTTIHLFVIQILNGNFAIARLKDFTKSVFSEAAYCKARCRLPLQVLETLLQRVGKAWRATMQDHGRWRGHRTFHVDGSSFSMPDTPELQKEFGQPGRQHPGCGFPVAHILTLFHAGTGFLLKVLAAPLRTHDMDQVAQVHPEMQAGDVLIGDRAFCSFAQFALLLGRKLHGLFRAHQRLIISFRPDRSYNGPGTGKRRKGLPSSRWLQKLGTKDQLVEYFKPKKRPEWMTPDEFAALPTSITLRELRYRIVQRGRRTKQVTL